jgi:6-phosphogluconolactonase/glucosamine-6-phosphate isomerase/deaminase
MGRKAKVVYANTLRLINKCSKKALRQRQVNLALATGNSPNLPKSPDSRRSTVSMANP